MNIILQSDLHHEFFVIGTWAYNVTTGHEEDVLVLAGDIDSDMVTLSKFIREVSAAFKAVVMVAGNHEYYTSPMEEVHRVLEDLTAEIENFHFLRDQTVTISETLFIGATMWTGFRKEDPMIMSMAQGRMNDYRRIIQAGVLITPHDVLLAHRKSKEFVFNELENAPEDLKTVVITHHAPSMTLMDQDYRHSGDINFCYYNDFDEQIVKLEPTLWLYGHTHASTWRTIGKTIVTANPHGYHNYEKNPNWQHDFEIDYEGDVVYQVK